MRTTNDSLFCRFRKTARFWYFLQIFGPANVFEYPCGCSFYVKNQKKFNTTGWPMYSATNLSAPIIQFTVHAELQFVYFFEIFFTRVFFLHG